MDLTAARTEDLTTAKERPSLAKMEQLYSEALGREQYWIDVSGNRMLVIGMIATALGIEDLESAYSDPAVILQAIEELKGTSNV